MKASYAKKIKGAASLPADPLPASGRLYRHTCPYCGGTLELNDLKNGGQAYWCHHCGRGHRAGELPPGSLTRREAAPSAATTADRAAP